MFIIFGWLKEEVFRGGFLRSYCFNCSDMKRWQLKEDTEWVTFFHIKTIPFLQKKHLICERCGDSIKISLLQYMTFSKNSQAANQFIESFQLSNKTEIQKRYLLSKRQDKEL